MLADAGPAIDRANLDGATAPPDELAPHEQRWATAFKLHVVGAMARLARSVECRKDGRRHATLEGAVRRLGSRVASHHVDDITAVLDMLDDEPLLLVDLPAGRVTRLRVAGIRNGFHLMTLLDGKDPFALVNDGVDTVSEEHGYFAWLALSLDASRGFAAERHGHILWGETRAGDIPMFEGARTRTLAVLPTTGRSR